MAEKSPKITEMEQSLINFLVSKKDVDDKVSGGARRVRGLSININLKENTFGVQIGMCEAQFNGTSGLKERGNCFGLERYIRDWYERPSIKLEMDKIFQANKTDMKKKAE